VPVPRSWAELTPDWLTSALALRYPGVEVGTVEVTGVQRGTNDRATLRVTYRTGAGPERLFVKREGSVLNRLALLALGAWDAEARLAAAGTPLPLEHPALLAAGVDRRRLATVVLMDDVTVGGGRPRDARLAVPVEQVRHGLLGLARLHASYWQRPLPAALGFVRPWRLGATWAPVSWSSLAAALRLLRRAGHADLVPAGSDARSLERGFRAWAHAAARGPQTLLHGDPHPGNTYELPGDGTGFYDWQLVRSGSWVHDVGYFLTTSLAVRDRRACERELLGDYLDALAASGAPAPRFGDAWALYRRTPTYGLPAWLHTLTGGTFQPREVCLAVIERLAAAYVDLDSGRG
jgi:hypothetical protein